MSATAARPAGLPEYIQVGARVAEIRLEHDGMHITTSPVAKIGMRDVLLENGNRYNANSLQRNIGGVWGSLVSLLPMTHLSVRQALNDTRTRAAEAAVRVAHLALLKSCNFETATALAAAANALAGLLAPELANLSH